MNKKVPIYTVIITAVLAAVVAFNATFIYLNEKYSAKLSDAISGYAYFDKLLSIDDYVKKFYIGKPDDKNVETAVIRGYLEGIGDKYAAYMTSEEYARFIDEQNGSSVGIGVNVIYNSESGYIEIINVYENFSADKAGLRSGDLIYKIDGASVKDDGYYNAIDRITGEIGTTVNISVYRGEESLDFTVERCKIEIVSVTYRVYSKDTSVGFVRLSEFNSTTPQQFKNAIDDLKSKGCDKFVFDLRNNGGGELNSILSILDYLLPEGPLAHVYYNSGEQQDYSSDSSFFDAKVAVLTNKHTASAAELFTSALKDYTDKGSYDATIVGTNTYGKGVLQLTFPLKDGSAFKISVGKYNPPYSENYDGVGIRPDIEVELSEEATSINFYKLTDENDNQLAAAVAAITQ